jgi:cysteine desulfurase
MYANNETGALQPIHEIGLYCSKQQILFHIDSAQAAGKVTMDYNTKLGHPSMITIVGHKIGAPKGIACLVINTNDLLISRTGTKQSVYDKNNDCNDDTATITNILQDYNGLLYGGGQEYGIRAGTENVPYIVGFGKACEICTNEWETNHNYMEQLRTLLLQELTNKLEHSNINNNNDSNIEQECKPSILLVHGPTNNKQRLPNTLSIGIRNINSSIMLQQIGHLVAASAGAACHSKTTTKLCNTNKKTNTNTHDAEVEEEEYVPTHTTQSSSTTTTISSVLKAMNVPIEYAIGTIRFSIGPLTTSDEIIQAATIVSNAVIESYTTLN